jgi:pyrroline-5-carboxylate reductase
VLRTRRELRSVSPILASFHWPDYIPRDMTYELGIIGAGNMAEAIAVGAIRAGLLTPQQMIAADPSPQRRGKFTETYRIRAVDNNAEVARASRIVLLSVKPQQMADALSVIGRELSIQSLVVSIAAGIGTAFIETHLGLPGPWRVVRVMPNTPMLVGEGMAAIAPGAHASEADVASARRLFESAGDVIEVAESQMDAVTALSGSGPAYVFFLVEQMIRAGVEMGFTPEQARQLANKTVLGAAKMLAGSTESPQELRRRVTSPGGTTHAAVTHMESRDLPTIVVDAIKAAERRGKELGG